MKRQKSFENNNAKLYLVGTPIGNLEDITFRAINTLKSVDIIYCEDTRTSYKLLNHYEITTKLKSVHLFNENEISHEIIDTIKSGLNVAIISDAGLPIISDPGWIVVKEAVENDIDVVSIPGATAGLTALIASGIPAHSFYFAGFLNSKKAKRKQELKKLYNKEETIIMYESPHRIEETLKIINKLKNKIKDIEKEIQKAPVKEIKKLAGRLPCVHFKDYGVVRGGDPQVQFAPIGDGNLDWDEIIAACKESGVKYALIEQDNSFGADPFECLKRSYDFLISKGLEAK